MEAKVRLNGGEVLSALEIKQLEQLCNSQTKMSYCFSTQTKLKRKADNNYPIESTSSASATLI